MNHDNLIDELATIAAKNGMTDNHVAAIVELVQLRLAFESAAKFQEGLADRDREKPDLASWHLSERDANLGYALSIQTAAILVEEKEIPEARAKLTRLKDCFEAAAESGRAPSDYSERALSCRKENFQHDARKLADILKLL